MSILSCSIEHKLRREFERIADRQHVTVSALLRSLVVDCIAEEAERAKKPAPRAPYSSVDSGQVFTRKPGRLSSQVAPPDELAPHKQEQTKGDLRRMLAQAVANTPGARKA